MTKKDAISSIEENKTENWGENLLGKILVDVRNKLKE